LVSLGHPSFRHGIRGSRHVPVPSSRSPTVLELAARRPSASPSRLVVFVSPFVAVLGPVVTIGLVLLALQFALQSREIRRRAVVVEDPRHLGVLGFLSAPTHGS